MQSGSTPTSAGATASAAVNYAVLVCPLAQARATTHMSTCFVVAIPVGE